MPKRTALICDGRVPTFAALEERADRLAHHLASVGIGRGDHMGCYAHNRVEGRSRRGVETLLAAERVISVQRVGFPRAQLALPRFTVTMAIDHREATRARRRWMRIADGSQ